MEKTNYSLLKHYMSDSDWCNSHENILTVGRILKDEYVLNTVGTVFDYFGQPWHFEPEIRELIKEYELDAVSEDFFGIPMTERELALEWMFALEVVSRDTYELLFDDMEDKV